MWKRRIGWLLILAAALMMYLFENNSGTRILLASAALLPLGSALALFLPQPGLTARVEVPETVNRGERVRCSLVLENGAVLPLARVQGRLEICNLLTGERTGLAVERALGGRETERQA